jgi:ParB family chromosome partitioning protein
MNETQGFKLIPLAQLHESLLNPRRHFDEARMAELTDSVRVHGILTPLLVRPNSDGYEIAAGHRRFRAALRAELAEAPAVVRAMTDQQFVEVVTIENLQREDVHPIEEAAGYQRLIGSYGYTPAMLAERVGRSESYIAKRLALTRLIEPAKSAFLEGRIQLGHALLLARLQPDDQQEAFKEALFERGERWGGGKRVKVTPAAVSVSSLDDWIRENVYLDLSSAAWRKDDVTLLAGAGACISCTKRSGANGLLFDDVKKGDICLDAECFHQKRDNHLIAVQKAAEEKGTPLVRIAREYVPDASKQGVLSTGAYHLISGKTDRCEYAEKAVIAVGSREIGKITDICRTKACKKHGNCLYGSGVAGGQKTSAEMAEERRERLAKKIDIAARQEVLRDAVGQIPFNPGPREFTLIAQQILPTVKSEARKAIAYAFSAEHTTDWGKLEERIEKMDQGEVVRFLVACCLAEGATEFSWEKSKQLLSDMALSYGVPVKTVSERVAAPLKLKFEKSEAARKKREAAEKAASKKKAGAISDKGETKPASAETKKAKRGTTAATARVWPKPNEHGVYDPKDCISIPYPGKDLVARILLVETENGWIGSFEAGVTDAGTGGFPGAKDQAFPSQMEALEHECTGIITWVGNARATQRSNKSLAQLSKLQKWARKLQEDARDVGGQQRVASGERDPADPDVRTCRVCGCTDNDCRGCIERTGEPCHWVAPDLCSACEGEES